MLTKKLLITVLITCAACSGGPKTGQTPSASPSVVEPSPQTPVSVLKIAMNQPNFMAVTDDAVWVTRTVDDSIARVNPTTNRIVASVKVGHSPGAIAFGFGRLWVANVDDATMTVVDPRSGNRVVQTIKLDGAPDNIATGLGFVWVASSGAGAVWEINPVSGKVERTITLAGSEDVVAGDAGVWAGGPGTKSVSKINPATGTIAMTVDVPGGLHSLAFGEGSLWIGSGPNGNSVTRIDPATGKIAATIAVEPGAFPDRTAFASGAVYVGEYRRNAVLKIDPASNTIASRIAVGPGPAVVVTGFGSLWVANYLGDSLWRIPL